MKLSQAARNRLTEPWEECVLYVYDDKVPKRRINGRLAYPEWDGGAVHGTLTIGFGHTDAAGGLKIRQGLRLTREQADELLSADIAPCERAVARALKVEVTQHQFDAVVDTYFNCPSGALAAVKLINAGRPEAVPAKLLQYIYSKGERMQGLVNRRNAEIAWFNTPDGAEQPSAPHPDVVFSPKAERNPPPKPMRESKTGAAAVTVGLGTAAEAASQANDALEQARTAKDTLEGLGVWDHLAALASKPMVLVCIGVIVLAAFIWLDRRNKLVNDHV
ncbi:lysozyme [Bradyrhizobium sp. 188]|uniref:lysozyme n=1 Tax=Bradyrhizobium sp. 188 TaxID=2782656 RepID=UPI001FF951DD|nr:lysozyme [Bradyrhizobium sp. 188]MCK1501511.1 lysozyme [Bradyrhizobium sp. 188]